MTNLIVPRDCVCAVLTPIGRGAVATVGVRGVGAVEIVGRVFVPAHGKPLTDFAASRVVFGRFMHGAGALEEMVVGLVGEDEVELHCHGGTAAVEAVITALANQGCRRVTAEKWASLTEPDAIRTEALVALAGAQTERTAAILLDQYRDALSGELERIIGELEAGHIAAARESLDRLLAARDLGLHLTRPWKIVLAGRPNIGKSSLINALLGYQRAIVFDQPGTTRDVLTAAAAFDGCPVELSDTAGLRAGGDAIEVEGVARARQQMQAADLVLLVADAAAGWTADDQTLFDELKPLHAERLIVVCNKCDLTNSVAGNPPPAEKVSAKTDLGLDELMRRIVERLVPALPAPGAAVAFTERQFELLAAARGQLPADQDAGRQDARPTEALSLLRLALGGGTFGSGAHALASASG